MKSRFVILGLLLFVSMVAFGNRPKTAPLEGNLIGEWVGFDARRPDFYRLSLRPSNISNTSKLVFLYPDGKRDIYSVRWKLTDNQLQLDAFPVTTNAESIVCSVAEMDFHRIDLVISGVSDDWKRNALLMNEKLLAAGIAESANHESKATPR